MITDAFGQQVCAATDQGGDQNMTKNGRDALIMQEAFSAIMEAHENSVSRMSIQQLMEAFYKEITPKKMQSYTKDTEDQAVSKMPRKDTSFSKKKEPSLTRKENKPQNGKQYPQQSPHHRQVISR